MELHAEAKTEPTPKAEGTPPPARPTSDPRKRSVCDHCRRRRIRCDGRSPCQQCRNAALSCRRDHVPRKRGPKKGQGKVINELRAQEAHERLRGSRESSVELDNGIHSAPQSSAGSVPSTPTDITWTKVTSDPRHAPEPKSIFSSEQYRPTGRSFLHLVPLCVELYYEHIYPIMPLPYMPAVQEMILRPMSFSEKNYIYSMCALTSFHMLGQGIDTHEAMSWEDPGRFFLDECIAVRQDYDFLEDISLHAVVSSFWLSTSHFEINQSRKSWLYLREALTLALELGIQDDSTYVGLSPEETLCRQRVFWQLFVTERSFAILRSKPITFRKTPSLPTTRHSYEAPDIHSGFLQLISSYRPLDESFVTAWNEGSDPRVTAMTYLALQDVLSHPPAFLSRPSTPMTQSPTSSWVDSQRSPEESGSPTTPTASEPAHETTAIQKADLLITQQWLRLIVWQSSFRQGLLTWSAGADRASMNFAFPLSVAARTASVLRGLPPAAVEVHGMGIFEKIFEIGSWCLNVLDAAAACGANLSLAGGAGGEMLGMEFLGGHGTDLGVLGVGRKGVFVDPLEFFVRTLSASPNSRKLYAERLLEFAGQRPGGMRMALSPALSVGSDSGEMNGGGIAWSSGVGSSIGGSVLGEVTEDEHGGDGASQGLFEMSGALGGNTVDVLPELDDMDIGIVSDMDMDMDLGLVDIPVGEQLGSLPVRLSVWEEQGRPGYV